MKISNCNVKSLVAAMSAALGMMPAAAACVDHPVNPNAVGKHVPVRCVYNGTLDIPASLSPSEDLVIKVSYATPDNGFHEQTTRLKGSSARTIALPGMAKVSAPQIEYRVGQVNVIGTGQYEYYASSGGDACASRAWKMLPPQWDPSPWHKETKDALLNKKSLTGSLVCK